MGFDQFAVMSGTSISKAINKMFSRDAYQAFVPSDMRLDGATDNTAAHAALGNAIALQAMRDVRGSLPGQK